MTRFAWEAECSRGSKGPWDVRAKSGTNTLLLQVKTTRKQLLDSSSAAQHARRTVSTVAAKRLERAARSEHGTAMVCVCSGTKLWMFVLQKGAYTENYFAESIQHAA